MLLPYFFEYILTQVYRMPLKHSSTVYRVLFSLITEGES